jgi:hypothetical protein
MSAQFWPCPGCSRHIKRGDAICPFCGVIATVETSPARTPAGRLSRAALFAAGALGTAVAGTNCGGNITTYPPYGLAAYIPEDSSASDGPSEAASDAGDSSATTVPIDSSSVPDVLWAAMYGSPCPMGPCPIELDDSSASDGSSDAAAEARATSLPTDSSTAADAPSSVAPYGQPPIPVEE